MNNSLFEPNFCSPSPFDLALLAETEDRDPVLSPHTQEVDENSVFGGGNRYPNPDFAASEQSCVKSTVIATPIPGTTCTGAGTTGFHQVLEVETGLQLRSSPRSDQQLSGNRGSVTMTTAFVAPPLDPSPSLNSNRMKGNTTATAVHSTALPPALSTVTRSALTPRADTNHTPLNNMAAPASGGAFANKSSSRRLAPPPRPNATPFNQKETLTMPRGMMEERPPRNSAASSSRITSNVSIKSSRSAASGDPTPHSTRDYSWNQESCPDSHEQALFEQRLCEDAYGVAIRKINQNGKSNLRYVKCVVLEDGEDASVSNKSVGGMVRSFSRRARSDRSVASTESGRVRKVLQWGKKRDCRVLLDQFTCVRKGKTTDRTRRNVQQASRLLSLITSDVNHPSLDIEAPTRVDRDKFARAFAKFLRVPLESDAGDFDNTVDLSPTKPGTVPPHSVPDMDAASKRSKKTGATAVGSASSSAPAENMEIQFEDNTPGAAKILSSTPLFATEIGDAIPRSQGNSISIPTRSGLSGANTQQAIVSGFNPDEMGGDDATAVSSLTGAGYDQEIVEELHHALTELRAELEASRAEATRAVKVAEQAIQSAENSGSKDWNSTVTHKAAEAAALAQKRSAEAMAKARLAEERLAGERRTASFWRRQAEVAEEEAGVLQTRAAAAEVQRASMAEELESERRKAITLMAQLKQRFSSSDVLQREAIESAMERNRSLEIELDGTRRDLMSINEEAKSLKDELNEATFDGSRSNNRTLKKTLSFGGKKKRNADARDPSSSQSLLSSDAQSSSFTAADTDIKESSSGVLETLPAEQVQKLSAEFSAVKLQFELLKRTTLDELNSLPESSKAWAAQVSQALATSEAEVSRLRSKLALESSTRRKLLHEVQDLRGAVRVYCRPRPVQNQNQDGANTKPDSILSAPSREILLLHREKLPGVQEQPPMAFEFDRIFDPQMDQADVYGELEELVLNILDGYNVCMLAFGQTGSGKTHSLIGDIIYKLDESFETAPVVDIENYGIHLLGAKQLFNVAEHRSERYQDMFFLTLVEVNDERLCDLIAGTEIGSSLGRVEGDNSITRNKKDTRIFQHNRGNSDEIGTSTHGSNKLNKLEIRTSEDGETVVQGLVSVPISRIEDVCEVWRQALSLRADRLQELNANICDYDAGSHVIATIKVMSTNIATGIGTMGKIQFVDLAGADLDLVTRRPPSGTKSKLASTSDGLLAGVGNSCEWKYTHKSLATFSDVVSARSQFMRSVPYRNSTLTHLLRDSLEADTKVMMLVTVSSDPKHAQETACALRLASRIRRVNIGKATKHSVSQV